MYDVFKKEVVNIQTPYPAQRWSADGKSTAMVYNEADDKALGPGWYDRPADPRRELNPAPKPEPKPEAEPKDVKGKK